MMKTPLDGGGESHLEPISVAKRIYSLSLSYSSEREFLFRMFLTCWALEASLDEVAANNFLCYVEDFPPSLTFCQEAWANTLESPPLVVDCIMDDRTNPLCRKCGAAGLPMPPDRELFLALMASVVLGLTDGVELCRGCGSCTECHKHDDFDFDRRTRYLDELHGELTDYISGLEF